MPLDTVQQFDLYCRPHVLLFSRLILLCGLPCRLPSDAYPTPTILAWLYVLCQENSVGPKDFQLLRSSNRLGFEKPKVFLGWRRFLCPSVKLNRSMALVWGCFHPNFGTTSLRFPLPKMGPIFTSTLCPPRRRLIFFAGNWWGTRMIGVRKRPRETPSHSRIRLPKCGPNCCLS